MTKPILLVEALGARNDSGLGKLVRLILENLSKASDSLDIYVLLPKNCEVKLHPNIIPIYVNPKPMRFWIQFVFPLWILKKKPTAVLCLGWTLPWFRPKARYGLMLADIGPLENLDMVASNYDRANRKWLISYPKHADIIFTISNFSKQRIIELLPILADSIKVVKPIFISPLIPASNFSLVKPQSEFVFPAGQYFLTIGNIEPRKNFVGLILAYALLKKKFPKAPPLYIVGNKAWGFLEAEAAAVRVGVAHEVFFTGYLSEVERIRALQNCTLYISSSLYEGWGLPLFEALSMGLPAIYHKGTCQDEFAEGFALGTDCTDKEKFALTLETMWLDQSVRIKYMNALRLKFSEILKYDLADEFKTALTALFQSR